MKKDRRNLIVYRVSHLDVALALCFSDDYEAEKTYLHLIENPFYSQIEWFGREFDSYELEVSSEDR